MAGHSQLNEELSTLLNDVHWRTKAMEALALFETVQPLLQYSHQGQTLSIPFIDVVCQSTWKRHTFFSNLYGAILWQQVISGKTSIGILPTAQTPVNDNRPLENQATIEAALQPYVGAVVTCRSTKSGADGSICFRKCPMSTALDSENETNLDEEWIFPLEIGACMPHQIEVHLSKGGNVARFPYGWRAIVLISRI